MKLITLLLLAFSLTAQEFTLITSGEIATDSTNTNGASWIDFETSLHYLNQRTIEFPKISRQPTTKTMTSPKGEAH